MSIGLCRWPTGALSELGLQLAPGLRAAAAFVAPVRGRLAVGCGVRRYRDRLWPARRCMRDRRHAGSCASGHAARRCALRRPHPSCRAPAPGGGAAGPAALRSWPCAPSRRWRRVAVVWHRVRPDGRRASRHSGAGSHRRRRHRLAWRRSWRGRCRCRRRRRGGQCRLACGRLVAGGLCRGCVGRFRPEPPGRRTGQHQQQQRRRSANDQQLGRKAWRLVGRCRIGGGGRGFGGHARVSAPSRHP